MTSTDTPQRGSATVAALKSDGAPDEEVAERASGPGRNEFGAISLSNQVVAKIVAQAVTEVPDAGAAAPRILGQSVPSALPGALETKIGSAPKANVDVDLSVASIEVVISVRWPAPVPAVTAAVRARIIERLAELTGLHVTDVRVHVSDLTTRASSAPRVR